MNTSTLNVINVTGGLTASNSTSSQNWENENPNRIRRVSNPLTPIIKRKLLTSPMSIGQDSAIDSPLEDGYDTANEITESLKKTAIKVSMGGNVSLSPSLNKTHQALQLRLEVDRLRAELQEKDKLLVDAQTKLDEKDSEIRCLKDRESMCIEDLKVKDFYCGVQDLKIQELEERLSSQRLEYHESVASKQRKYKNLVKKAQQEKADYESQSNSMMKQLNEQMMQLQTFAMQRIQTLEAELMKSSHENDQLKTKMVSLERAVQSYQMDHNRASFENRLKITPVRNTNIKVMKSDKDDNDEFNIELNTSTHTNGSAATERHVDSDDETERGENDENEEILKDEEEELEIDQTEV